MLSSAFPSSAVMKGSLCPWSLTPDEEGSPFQLQVLPGPHVPLCSSAPPPSLALSFQPPKGHLPSHKQCVCVCVYIYTSRTFCLLHERAYRSSEPETKLTLCLKTLKKSSSHFLGCSVSLADQNHWYHSVSHFPYRTNWNAWNHRHFQDTAIHLYIYFF